MYDAEAKYDDLPDVTAEAEKGVATEAYQHYRDVTYPNTVAIRDAKKLEIS